MGSQRVRHDWVTNTQSGSGVSSKESVYNAGDTEASGSIPGSERSSEGGNGNPLQYSCLGNLMDSGRLQSKGLQRVEHDWPHVCTHTHTHTHSLPLDLCSQLWLTHEQRGSRGHPHSEQSTVPIKLTVHPAYTWFRYLQDFTCANSIQHGWCSTILFAIEKKFVCKLTITVQTHVVQVSAMLCAIIYILGKIKGRRRRRW